MTTSIIPKQLTMSRNIYDNDVQHWIEQTIGQLQNRDFESLDIENLIDVLTEFCRKEQNELRYCSRKLLGRSSTRSLR
jgi:hypothetical protein